jgi:tetratricopeptide (TPR) repeat protein
MSIGAVYAQGAPVADIYDYREGSWTDKFVSPLISASKTFKGRAIYGGILQRHFGHFLVDGLSRLWYARLHPKLPIVWTGECKYTSWQKEILEILGIPVDNAIFVDEPMLFNELVIPKRGYKCFEYFDSEHAKLMGAYPSRIPVPGRFLYISRIGCGGSGGGYVNENEIEAVLKKRGWIIFYPERHSIREQLAAFSSAEIVMGVESSALHSVVLQSNLRSKVIALLRIGSKAYKLIAEAKQIDYTTIQCKSTYMNNIDLVRKHQANIHVDIDDFTYVIDTLMRSKQLPYESVYLDYDYTETTEYTRGYYGKRFDENIMNIYYTFWCQKRGWHMLSGAFFDKVEIGLEIEKSMDRQQKSFRGYLVGKLLQKKDFASAEAILANNTDSLESAAAYFNLARVYSHRQEVDEALRLVRKAIEIDPNKKDSKIFLATLLLKKGDLAAVEKLARENLDEASMGWGYCKLAQIAHLRGDTDEAIRWIGKALASNPESLQFKDFLASKLLQKGELEAVEALARANMPLPRSNWTYVKMAQVHKLRGDGDEAIRWIRKALQGDREARHCNVFLAECLLEKGDLEAVEVFVKKHLSQPDADWAYYKLAQVNHRRKNLDASIVCIRKALEIKPENRQYQFFLAVRLLEKGDLEAVEAFVKEHLSQPDADWAYHKLAQVNHRRKNLDASIVCIRKALEINPENRQYQFFLAVRLLEKGDLEAVEDFVKEHLSQPDADWAYHKLAQVNNSRKNLDASIVCIRKALEIKPENRQYTIFLADRLLDKGDLEAAEAFVKEHLSQPDADWANFTLAQVHKRRGKNEEARQWAEKALAIAPASQVYRKFLDSCG